MSETRDQRSLYLRWRPRRFAEVVAQDAVTRTLRNAVARGTVAHAYLLCGPRGTGKTSIARILYRALNCLQPADGEPCGACAACVSVDTGRAVDLIEMDAASHGGIDDVRDLRERVYFAPAEAATKVYIVDEAHQLTARAWDAFLKTLEEPPPRTVFVLATTEAHRVPATIVSRCQRFDLRRIPQGRLEGHLQLVARSESLELETGVAERLARLARGSLRDGLGMLDQLAAFAGKLVTMEAARTVLGLVRGEALRSYLDALSVGDAPRALQVLEDVTEEGADLRQFLDEVLGYLRGALLARSGAGAALEGHFGQEERQWLGELAQRWAPGQILLILRTFGEIESRGREEHHVLVRAELATAWTAELTAPALSRPETGPAGDRRSLSDRLPEVSNPASAARVSETPWGATEASGPEAGHQEEGAGGRAPEAEGSDSNSFPGGEDKNARPLPEGLAKGTRPSVAGLQAQWPALAERFQGNLFAKVMLKNVAPIGIQDDLITLAGTLGALDLQRLDTPECRSGVEALLSEAVGEPVRVRFRQTDEATQTLAARDDATPLAELGTALFGGRLLPE